MLHCPVCMGLGGTVNTQMTELDTELAAGNQVVEVVFECNFGHEFGARYAFERFMNDKPA